MLENDNTMMIIVINQQQQRYDSDEMRKLNEMVKRCIGRLNMEYDLNDLSDPIHTIM